MTGAVLGSVHGFRWTGGLADEVQDSEYLTDVATRSAERQLATLPVLKTQPAAARKELRSLLTSEGRLSMWDVLHRIASRALNRPHPFGWPRGQLREYRDDKDTGRKHRAKHEPSKSTAVLCGANRGGDHPADKPEHDEASRDAHSPHAPCRIALVSRSSARPGSSLF